MRRFPAIVAVAAAAALAMSACTSSKPKAAESPAPAQEAPIQISVTPADHASNVLVSSEIGLKITGGSVDGVSVVDAAGKEVPGVLRPDASSWVPSVPLRYKQHYTATVTAVGSRFHKTTQKVDFTTMAEPANLEGVGFFLFSGQQYGIGMPVPVEFVRDVPVSMRAAVQKRFFVTSDPPQAGAWHWFSGTQVQYRPATYWQTGTKLSVRLALKGQPLGDGYYGDEDKIANVSIANDRVEVKVTNSPKQMQVYRNGQLLRTMPVSLGKASTPSSSGHMVVMEQDYHTTFDTRNDPAGGYVAEVDYAQRLTWGGEFIHSAPWSVGDQGYVNVSHGCVNVGPDNAAWLFTVMKVGTPVTVSGTEVKLAPGNGWTDWDMDWKTFIAGSAIPVTSDVALANAYEPYPKPKPPSPSPVPSQAAAAAPEPTHS